MGVRLEYFEYKISESLTAVINRVGSIGSTEGVLCSFSNTLIATARNNAPLVLSFTEVESSIALHSCFAGSGRRATSSGNRL